MKKFLLLLMIATLPVFAFADDALQLPKGTLRLSQSTSIAFAVSEFNLDGEKVEIPVNSGRLLVLNLGIGLELGIVNWLSAAVRWTPGWNVWSTFDFPAAPSDMLTVNGPYDLLAEARVLLLGQQGLFRGDRLRLALAAAGKIPLPSPDWEEQISRRSAGEHWVQVPNDRHTPGLGGKAWLDLVLSRMFYLDIYSVFIRYFPKDYAQAELLAYLTPTYEKVDYGYELTVEAEPHIEFPIAKAVRLGVGVPVTYWKTPELEFDGTAVADSDTYLLTASPRLTLLLTRPAMEFRLGYTYPILGKGLNTPAMNSLSLQVRSYLRIYR